MKRKITVVRLARDVFVGKAMDLSRSLTNGGDIQGIPITLELTADGFLQVNFNGKAKEQKYSQLIPLSCVDTLLFEEVK